MKFDLNLFVVFDTIYTEGNITKAALALNLSQPAVSHALAKLRNHFDDNLFVRQGKEMRPTLVAKNVIADVRESLYQLQKCLAPSNQFVPITSRENFTISLHDWLEPTYLPRLMQNIIKDAPYSNLRSIRRIRRRELEVKLASGKVDLAVDVLLPVKDNIIHTQLTWEELVVVACNSHSVLKHRLDLEQYLSQSHVLVSSRSSGPSIEDFELSRIGLHRKVVLRCQNALSACRTIIGNDLLLTLPKSAAKMYSEILDIKIFPLPVTLPSIGSHLYWHINADNDPANKWLRNKIIATVAYTN